MIPGTTIWFRGGVEMPPSSLPKLQDQEEGRPLSACPGAGSPQEAVSPAVLITWGKQCGSQCPQTPAINPKGRSRCHFLPQPPTPVFAPGHSQPNVTPKIIKGSFQSQDTTWPLYKCVCTGFLPFVALLTFGAR